MARPRGFRKLGFRPRAYYFKPQGIPLCRLRETVLTKEEVEAIKLKDFDGLEQVEAAVKMKTSQSTFQRILTSARSKIARALILGEALLIEE